jgi:hypothetical protein
VLGSSTDEIGSVQIRLGVRKAEHAKMKMKPAIWMGLVALMPVFAWSHGTYSTDFPLTENPISEGGKWINGGAVGLYWTDVRTTPGLAFGTQPGNSSGPVNTDSTAVLAGTWGPAQTAQGTISVLNASGWAHEEVELRLRTTITAHSITGYEINASVSNAHPYIEINRWDGAQGRVTQLGATNKVLVNKDVLKATISGSTITAYVNGAQVLQVSDNTFSTGSPGIGFFLERASGLNADYGFSNFTATDGAPNAPLNLRITQ